MSPGAPVRILVFQNRFMIGGQERQTVLHLRTIDRSRWEPVLACLHLEGQHLADLEALGVRPEVFDVGRRMLRPNTLYQVARLTALIRRRRIALVHAQDLYTNVLGLMAARAAGVPSIVTRVDLATFANGYRRPLLRLASRVATRVLVNALAIRDLCIKDGVDPRRIAVVRNGLDLAAFDAAVRRPLGPPLADPSRPSLLIVANMNHVVKGHADLLAAMRQVIERFPRAQLLLVGDGPLRSRLERQAGELRLGEHCRFLGHRLDVPALLARATGTISASYAEGLSNAVLEAMASRLPVVGTAVGGTPELVRDGVNGWLVPPGSPAALSGRICDLLSDPERSRAMGEAGRRIVEREFAVERMRQAYDELYQELLRPEPMPLAPAAG